ncbi:MAG TPA: zinc ribbon domain-containing protein [Clostridia bacterium]|nr:zinc ribbon domain-containing protein [Clostridia bacterium]
MANMLIRGYGISDILGGIFKGLSGFMPQDDPEIRLYQAQAELNEMQPREAEIYADAGKLVTEQDGRTRFPGLFSQLELVKSNITAAQARLKSVKREKKKEKRDAEERRTCPNCGHINPDGVNFCQECGAKLVGPVKNICPACKTENDLGARFCGGYGARL